MAVEAVTGETGLGDFEALAKLHTLSGVPVPPAVDGLETAPVRHRTSVAAKDMQADRRRTYFGTLIFCIRKIQKSRLALLYTHEFIQKILKYRPSCHG